MRHQRYGQEENYFKYKGYLPLQTGDVIHIIALKFINTKLKVTSNGRHPPSSPPTNTIIFTFANTQDPKGHRDGLVGVRGCRGFDSPVVEVWGIGHQGTKEGTGREWLGVDGGWGWAGGTQQLLQPLPRQHIHNRSLQLA